MKRHISFFSGLRGFDLAAEKAGWENVATVEIDQKLNRRFAKKYPNATQYEDIRQTDLLPYRGAIDVVSAGWPCQPVSSAGKRKGRDDLRFLWPESIRGIREIQPEWVVGENVRGIVSIERGMVFEQVCADLENEGYEVQPFLLPAAGVNAPHERYRVWFVAHRNGQRGKGQQSESVFGTGKEQSPFAPDHTGLAFIADAAGCGRQRPWRTEGSDQSENNTEVGTGVFSEFSGLSSERTYSHPNGQRCQKFDPPGQPGWPGSNPWSNFDVWTEWTSEPPICIVDDGLPVGLDVARLRADLGRLYPAATEKNIERAIQKTITAYRNEMIKAYGNSVVWQIPYRIFMAINQYDQCP